MKAPILVLSAAGFFLSLWIFLPAPTLPLLTLSVGAPEVSPWLLGVNAILFLLTLKGVRRDRLRQAALSLSTVGLLLSLWPLSQFSTVAQRADAAMNRAFGSHYLAALPQSVLTRMRLGPFDAADALRGIALKTAIRFTPHISFAQPDGVSLQLDVYRPPQVGRYPGIIVIHGGAWRGGGPAQNAEFSRYMASQGYVVWAIAYRLAPRYQFPAQIEDVQSALNFIRKHATQYETDPQRLALMGRSAGAHLAMLAAYAPNAPIRALVDYYGPVDLAAGYRDVPCPDPLDTRGVLQSLLGGSPDERPELYRQASPITYIAPRGDRPLPPSLLIYGGRDRVVQAKYGRALEQRLRAAGTQAAFLEIPWADHAFDTVFNGLSNQLALYHTERFLAWALR
ncbi:alpha/beta hydrolase fold domain-containing protein [Altericista sp. CCNU0014]|uniref:alpha/beta hydrolase fold domain-containing protein n=1 Tax=Altericista sp. CCNU0014 TaxID=3082949 RepID=UPI00384B7CB5